jgi:hypothetical protein
MNEKPPRSTLYRVRQAPQRKAHGVRVHGLAIAHLDAKKAEPEQELHNLTETLWVDLAAMQRFMDLLHGQGAGPSLESEKGVSKAGVRVA